MQVYWEREDFRGRLLRLFFNRQRRQSLNRPSARFVLLAMLQESATALEQTDLTFGE